MALRARLVGFFLLAGLLHFLRPRPYIAIVPDAFPRKREIVFASGWWLIATLIAIFPANVNMAVNADRFRVVPEPLLWARLPLQAVLIAWVWRVAVR
jgi:uncharacterized membrane protein